MGICIQKGHSGPRLPGHPVTGAHELNVLLAPAGSFQQIDFRVRHLAVASRAAYAVMDRHDQPRTQHLRSRDGLLGCQYRGDIADRFAPAEAGAVDRQERSIEWPELAPDMPPRAVPQRVAAVDDPPSASRDDPRHLRITITVGSGYGR